ncbi:MAG: polyprenyl synthetase [Bacteroidetes bacterium GWF2_33_16]|nr:MAG: polyprenyl synthetase [Bacteroidetes bacterium GWE2_32_14]OFY03454.1 MAG: polyprenyl synthetase [Bacteroidetes bacterium GWF2_33_16]
MSDIDKIQNSIKEEMERFEPFFRSSMQTKVPLLNIIMNYILRRKGKQMRPMFVFLSAKMIKESVGDSTYTAASLIELLHTATLIHDDVVDEAYERRSFFSINALWKSKISVLVGDYLLSKGLLLAVEKNEYELLKIVSVAVREMSEGELLQIQKSRKLNINEEIYFEIIRKKTAALIAACAACGAKSSDADDETVEKMRLFGEYVGIAFQIKDDLLDYQNNGMIGKPSGNDLKEKKLTLPIIYALEKTSIVERKRIISEIKRNHKNKQKVQEIINFAIKNGGLEYTQQKMNEYRDKALIILNDFPENQSRKSLIDLVNYVVSRKK